jgi:hypothetical protein
VKKETPKSIEEAFVCMFCGRAGHLDEFCFRRKRIEKVRFEYARNSYRDDFFDFPPYSYSCAPLRMSSRALSCFSHGPNYHSYGFDSRENNFVPIHFGYGSCSHRGDHFSCRHGFQLKGLTLALSLNSWTVHIFPIVVQIPQVQMVRCKRL